MHIDHFSDLGQSGKTRTAGFCRSRVGWCFSCRLVEARMPWTIASIAIVTTLSLADATKPKLPGPRERGRESRVPSGRQSTHWVIVGLLVMASSFSLKISIPAR